MILAKTHSIDRYLAGRPLPEERKVPSADDRKHGDKDDGSTEDERDWDPMQKLLLTRGKHEIDRAIKQIKAHETGDPDAEGDRRAKIIAVTGPPGCGKSTCAQELIKYAVEQIEEAECGRVLATYPTGEMQSRMRQKLQAAGLNIDVDTCHGAFHLHKSEQDVFISLDEYVLVIVDEFPQLSRADFDRIVRLWENSGKIPLILVLGDFHQLPSIAESTAKDSGYWKHVFKVKLHTCWRADDDFLLKKLHAMRKEIPKKRMRNDILRGHKAWNQDGPPTEQDLRALYKRTKNNTTIATCTKRAAEKVNQAAAVVRVGRRRVLAELPADFEVNTENYTERGVLRTDRKPIPSRIELRRGLRVVLTKNLDKEHDFVNGMMCTVKAWNEDSRCLEVTTVTGRSLEVYQYTDPNPAAQNASYFPIRMGYASTIYKLQGSELEHITIYLDRPGHRAAAYVAMSRVRHDADYLFGGFYTKKHFVPNA
jgi:ATP-dependent exoDNAse (exonuclease V) alpha subunit